MQRKIIRCQSEDSSQSEMYLSPAWIVKFLTNPIWLAEHHLTPKEVSFDDYLFEVIRIHVDVFKRKDRLQLIDQSITLAQYYFSGFPYTVSSSLSFTSQWAKEEGIHRVSICDWISASDTSIETCVFDAEGNESVKAGLRAFKVFSPGWNLEKGDKVIVAFEGGNRSELEAQNAARIELQNDLLGDSSDTSYDWHPSHEGIGPEGLTDDERDVYYGL